MKRIILTLWICALLLIGLGGCETSTPSPPSSPSVMPSIVPTSTPTPSPTAHATATPTSTPSPTPLPTATLTPTPMTASIEVDAAAPGDPFSPYLLGSNLPAWLKPETFENEQFRRRVAATGITLLRIPGGSWGDEYGWLSCETKKDAPGAIPCRFTWASRPTDFINFFRGMENLGVHIEPMYIVNVNYTAQEAAALVAFYNAPLTDTTVIGLDRNGTDWKTAGDWAALRAAGGNERPLGIHWWEIGNEVHGGKPGVPGCKANGWEETWTCNGSEYISGTLQHDGFLQLRAAMLAVDPTIQVGAVGGSDSTMGNRWSEAVLRAGGDQMDYFVIHTYPSYNFYLGNLSKEWAEILALPQTHWRKLAESASMAHQYYANGRAIPIVINEYELTPPWGQNDLRTYMNRYVDALFIADSIGQMATYGVAMAAQWDVMNGPDKYGNEFGLMRADGTNIRQPKYYAFPLWSRFGATLLPVTSSARPEAELSVYTGRLDDGTLTLLALNKTGSEIHTQITFNGVARITGGLLDVVTAPSFDALTATYNGVADPADDLSDAPAQEVAGVTDNRLEFTFAPLAMTLLRLQVQ
ncbi:MAG TPA: alpha-L-arabinofuranosidase [Anaerolineae bacterium]|nr:alpha-L-arabinofuranosidase [Anaerolineae bacterium]HQI87312.1 alpha-L-arabinofuranosidase [Anaerolineae bacterium]